MSYKHKHYNELTEKKQDEFKEWWKISKLEVQEDRVHMEFDDEEIYSFVCKDYDLLEKLENMGVTMSPKEFDIMVYVWGSSLVSWR